MQVATLSAATILTTLIVGAAALVSALHPAMLRSFALLFSSMLGNGVPLGRTMQRALLYIVMLAFWLWLVGVTFMVFMESLPSHLLLAVDAVAVAILFTGMLRKLRFVLARHGPAPSPTAWRLTRKHVYQLRTLTDVMRLSLRLFPALLWYLSLSYAGVLLIMVTPASQAQLSVVAGFSFGVVLPFAFITLLVNQRRARLISVLVWTDARQRGLYLLQALLLGTLAGVLLFYLYDTFTVVQWIVGQVPY